MSATRERLLLVDIGNTRCKLAWTDGNDLKNATCQEFIHGGTVTAVSGGILEISPPDRVIIACVAQEKLARQFGDWCRQRWQVPVDYLSTEKEAGGLRNGYKEPSQLGLDRWLAMLGGWMSYRHAFIVVDSGTATTLDWVDDTGMHQGGWIIPGLGLMQSSLNAGTAALPETQGTGESNLPADNTQDAIRNGVLSAQAGAILGFIRHVHMVCQRPIMTIFTGGAAGAIMDALENTLENTISAGLAPEYIKSQHIKGRWLMDERLIFRGMLETYRLQ